MPYYSLKIDRTTARESDGLDGGLEDIMRSRFKMRLSRFSPDSRWTSVKMEPDGFGGGPGAP